MVWCALGKLSSKPNAILVDVKREFLDAVAFLTPTPVRWWGGWQTLQCIGVTNGWGVAKKTVPNLFALKFRRTFARFFKSQWFADGLKFLSFRHIVECWANWGGLKRQKKGEGGIQTECANHLQPPAANHGDQATLSGVLNTHQRWFMEICNYGFCGKARLDLWCRTGALYTRK